LQKTHEKAGFILWILHEKAYFAKGQEKPSPGRASPSLAMGNRWRKGRVAVKPTFAAGGLTPPIPRWFFSNSGLARP